MRSGWRDAVGLYVLYHWLELWDWLASANQTAGLAAISDQKRLSTAPQ